MASIEIIAVISLAILAISLFTLIIALIPILSQANRTLSNLNETLKILNDQIMPNLSDLSGLVGKAKHLSTKVGDSTKNVVVALKDGLRAGLGKYFANKQNNT
jgi:uncharacterized protein YoxC